MKKKAFTLVELLVSVAIIGVLMALFTVAIGKAREATRRNQCFHNMRGLGTAISNYEDAKKEFPPAVKWSGIGESVGKGIYPLGLIDRVSLKKGEDRTLSNWAILMLPFLEEDALYSRYDPKQPLHKAEFLYSTDIEIFKCPSDEYNKADNHYQRVKVTEKEKPNKGYARGNYTLNAGSNQPCLMRLSKNYPGSSCKEGWNVNGSDLEKNTTELWGSGIGGVNKSFYTRDFPNGFSRVVAFDEILCGHTEHDRRGVWALGFAGSSITACQRIGPNGIDTDRIQGCGENGNGDYLPCENSGGALSVCEKAVSRSNHSGGVCAAMLDGSVTFIENSIESKVWYGIHKRDSDIIID